MSLEPNVTVPREGRSNPLRRLTSVVLPAPLGPIRPSTSPGASSRSMSDSASMPSKERDTPRARSESGPRVSARAAAVNVRPAWRSSVDVRDLLRGDQAEVLGPVVVDLDHPVGPTDRAVQRRGEAD